MNEKNEGKKRGSKAKKDTWGEGGGSRIKKLWDDRQGRGLGCTYESCNRGWEEGFT